MRRTIIYQNQTFENVKALDEYLEKNNIEECHLNKREKTATEIRYYYK